jgi:guanylate kinase
VLKLSAPDTGVLFVLSGPSGVGKSTLIHHARTVVPGLGFSVSATTRDPREGEVDGRDYHFLDRSRFEAMLADGAFLEHAEVYGRYYGTPAGPIREAMGRGESILLDIDVQGAAQVRAALPEAVTVFILPPDRASLRARLQGRGTDSEAIIDGRMRKADEQLAACGSYDHLIVNDDLETAKHLLVGVLTAALTRTSHRHTLVSQWTGSSLPRG